jgi:hypothetical protein
VTMILYDPFQIVLSFLFSPPYQEKGFANIEKKESAKVMKSMIVLCGSLSGPKKRNNDNTGC